ncbi:MAG: CBS domain-containing protein [Bacteroidia bacterium]|nr:CBS domain-containing protein [Bacteroidia bacterium]NND09638.1 CBS domain-containing protein [Flavobacteriaceae bacterium]MBT8310315.1 CBS domain-containing protein [Bacteroidia bacterium]NNK28718.1 CBS domain-containing protein [Flavobacteriaceae bacterium]NNL60194.1 CBS domain-containing protein [Flavobacteriaceae bacterium]
MGIKSFQGSRKNVEQESDHIRVFSYMTRKLVTFSPEDSIETVINSLIKNRISGAPVVNENNELIGMISEGDCIKQLSESRYFNMPMGDTRVKNHMVENVETIDGHISIFDAANKFLESKRRRFPVLENGKLVGQISQMDVLKAAMKLKGQKWK